MSTGAVHEVPLVVLDAVWMMSLVPSERCQIAVSVVPSLLLVICGLYALRPGVEMLVGVVQVVPLVVLDVVWMMSFAPSKRVQVAVSLVPSLLLVICGSYAPAPGLEMLVGVDQVVPLVVLDADWMMLFAPSERHQMTVSVVPSLLLVICGLNALRPGVERLVGVVQVVPLVVLDAVWMMKSAPSERIQVAVSLVPSLLLVICGESVTLPTAERFCRGDHSSAARTGVGPPITMTAQRAAIETERLHLICNFMSAGPSLMSTQYSEKYTTSIYGYDEPRGVGAPPLVFW